MDNIDLDALCHMEPLFASAYTANPIVHMAIQLGENEGIPLIHALAIAIGYLSKQQEDMLTALVRADWRNGLFIPISKEVSSARESGVPNEVPSGPPAT